MKTLYLFFGRIIAYARSRPAVFSMYCIGAVLTAVCMISMYASFISADKYADPAGRYTYRIYADKSALAGKDAANALLDSLPAGEKLLCAGVSSSCDRGSVYGEGRGNIQLLLCRGNVFILPTVSFDLSGEPANTALLPASDASRIGEDGTALLFGKPHRIAGTFTFGDGALIVSQKSDIWDNVTFDGATVVYNYPLSANEANTLRDAAQKYLGSGARLSLPLTQRDEYSRQLPINLILISLVGAAAILSFMFLYSYLLYSRGTESVVMLICGESEFRAILSCIAECLVLNTALFAVAAALYLILREPLMSKILAVSTVKAGDIFTVYGCFALVCLITAAPFIAKFGSGSIIKARNEMLK